jgi:hypothetical protein
MEIPGFPNRKSILIMKKGKEEKAWQTIKPSSWTGKRGLFD